MPWRPQFPGEAPTLGYYALDWITQNLAAPDREVYEPFIPTQEQAEFLLRFYELDPVTGRRVIRRGVLSRSRGWGKSPFLSAIAILEGLGDVVPDGWNAQGQPVGKPWARIRTPLVQIAAASEAQTSNSWEPLLEMLSGAAPVFDNYPGVEPLSGFVNLPWGRIEPVTTSATSLKGKRPIMVIADQTEQWTPGNGAAKVYEVILNNATKVGGSVIESPNAYTPGLGSVAETTAKAAADILEGRNTKLFTGMLYDHREASGSTELGDEKSLLTGLRFAYGDSSDHPDGCVLHQPACPPGWVDLRGVMERIWQTDSDEQVSRSDWLNQVTHAPDAWLSGPDVQGAQAQRQLEPGEQITLGFDGSRGRSKGKPDATALIGCRVSDGHLFRLGIWEAGNDQVAKLQWDSWEPPIPAIEAEIASAFSQYQVVAFYCDPARDWRSHVNAWEARWQTPHKASRDHPFEWWMTGGRSILVERAVEGLEGAIRNRDCTYDGDPQFTKHLLAARRRIIHSRLAIAKDGPHSMHKIDAAVAAVLAWQARTDVMSSAALMKDKPSVTTPGRNSQRRSYGHRQSRVREAVQVLDYR